MPDSRFFPAPLGPFSLAELAAVVRARLWRGDPAARVADVANLAEAGPQHVSFFTQPRPVYLQQLDASRAAAVITGEKHAAKVPATAAVLVTDNPHLSMTLAMRAFYPPAALQDWLEGEGQAAALHPGPIHPSARIGKGSRVEVGAVIGAGVEIGENCHIGPNAVIRPQVQIGNQVRIGANATVAYACIGDGSVIYPGAVIGSAGFGFSFDPQSGAYVDIPHLGVVRIGRHVHVGDNACVARGSMADTVLADGVRIDNMVQVAHNVQIGALSVIAGHTSLAGSVTVGQGVQIGGNSAVANHLHIGDGAKIGGMSGVVSNVAPGAVVMGQPAVDQKEFHRLLRAQRSLLRRSAPEGS